MSISTPNTSSSIPAADCAPFSGLGHVLGAVVAVAQCLRPRWAVVPVLEQPILPPVKTYGYALQCRLGRETRAG